MQKHMNMAADLLANTNMKIYTVSETVGYKTQEHFNRIFRKYFGDTPTEYRKKHQ